MKNKRLRQEFKDNLDKILAEKAKKKQQEITEARNKEVKIAINKINDIKRQHDTDLEAKDDEIENLKKEITSLTAELIQKYTKEINKRNLESQKKWEDYEEQLSHKNNEIASVRFYACLANSLNIFIYFEIQFIKLSKIFY
jgi:hypothetical protein